MSYDLIDRKDQRIDTIFKGLENMERMIDAIRTAPRPAFHSDYFLTDEELSKLLKVSRRTLQEYRTRFRASCLILSSISVILFSFFPLMSAC